MSLTALNPTEDAVRLPREAMERYGIRPGTDIRIIETCSGIPLVPVTNEPMSAELQAELAAWQEASLESLNMFPYEQEES